MYMYIRSYMYVAMYLKVWFGGWGGDALGLLSTCPISFIRGHYLYTHHVVVCTLVAL